MTADEIKALVERLRGIAEYKASLLANRYQKQAQGPEIEAATALESLLAENQRLSMKPKFGDAIKVAEIVQTVSGHTTVAGNELWIFMDKYVGCDLYAAPKEKL